LAALFVAGLMSGSIVGAAQQWAIRSALGLAEEDIPTFGRCWTLATGLGAGAGMVASAVAFRQAPDLAFNIPVGNFVAAIGVGMAAFQQAVLRLVYRGSYLWLLLGVVTWVVTGVAGGGAMTMMVWSAPREFGEVNLPALLGLVMFVAALGPPALSLMASLLQGIGVVFFENWAAGQHNGHAS